MMILNLGELDLDNPEEVVEILSAIKVAGLRISNVQIKGSRLQTQQFFDYLPKSMLSKRRSWQKLMATMVPAALSSISSVVLGLWLWV